MLTQPGEELKPAVPHPRLPPIVTSFMALGLAYKVGFMNPTVDLPAFRRAWLIKVTMAPMTGALAEVPTEGRLVSGEVSTGKYQVALTDIGEDSLDYEMISAIHMAEEKAI